MPSRVKADELKSGQVIKYIKKTQVKYDKVRSRHVKLGPKSVSYQLLKSQKTQMSS